MTPTIATIDLQTIHKIFQDIKKEYPLYNERFQYFLAACHHIHPDFDLDLAIKFQPYGGLIGIDNSRLDRYLNHNKILRLHAILHDATGFIYELTRRGPGQQPRTGCPHRRGLSSQLSAFAEPGAMNGSEQTITIGLNSTYLAALDRDPRSSARV